MGGFPWCMGETKAEVNFPTFSCLDYYRHWLAWLLTIRTCISLPPRKTGWKKQKVNAPGQLSIKNIWKLVFKYLSTLASLVGWLWDVNFPLVSRISPEGLSSGYSLVVGFDYTNLSFLSPFVSFTQSPSSVFSTSKINYCLLNACVRVRFLGKSTWVETLSIHLT